MYSSPQFILGENARLTMKSKYNKSSTEIAPVPVSMIRILVILPLLDDCHAMVLGYDFDDWYYHHVLMNLHSARNQWRADSEHLVTKERHRHGDDK